jgi:hypothetical protein
MLSALPDGDVTTATTRIARKIGGPSSTITEYRSIVSSQWQDNAIPRFGFLFDEVTCFNEHRKPNRAIHLRGTWTRSANRTDAVLDTKSGGRSQTGRAIYDIWQAQKRLRYTFATYRACSFAKASRQANLFYGLRLSWLLLYLLSSSNLP